MAVYKCFDCQEFVDDDHFPCSEHPTLPTELLCPSCVERQQPARSVPRGTFTQAQLDEIKKLEAESENDELLF